MRQNAGKEMAESFGGAQTALAPPAKTCKIGGLRRPSDNHVWSQILIWLGEEFWGA